MYVDTSKTPNSSELQRYIEQITDSKCEFYNENTKAYFDWHFRHHK